MSDRCPMCGLGVHIEEPCCCKDVIQPPKPECPMPDVPHEAHVSMCAGYTETIARLTRENEELRAMFAPQPANKTIDDLARVAFEAFWEGFDTLDTWDNQREGFKDQWRRVVRRVLEAKAKGRESVK